VREDPVLFTERGILCKLRGDVVAARFSFERALETTPPFPNAFIQLAAMAVEGAMCCWPRPWWIARWCGLRGMRTPMCSARPSCGPWRGARGRARSSGW